MSMYDAKFATQHPPTLFPYGPANVETIYQTIRNIAAIEKHRNCQWASTFPPTGQAISVGYKLCGRILSYNVRSLGFYLIIRTDDAFDGIISIMHSYGNIVHDVSFAAPAAGVHYRKFRVFHDHANPDIGSSVHIKSDGRGLSLLHLGIYENEDDPPPSLYPAQIRRPLAGLLRGLAEKLNNAAHKKIFVGGWVSGGGYAVTANSAPPTPQFCIYHGLRYAESKSPAYQQIYTYLGEASVPPDIGDLAYAIESEQSGDYYAGTYAGGRLAYKDIYGGSWSETGPTRSILNTSVWRTAPTAKVNVNLIQWVANKKHGVTGRPDVVDVVQEWDGAGEIIREDDWTAIWRAAHYGHVHGVAKPFLCYVIPGGAVYTMPLRYQEVCWAAVPVDSWVEPWGWGKIALAKAVPLRFWIAWNNATGTAKNISIKITWGKSESEHTISLDGGTGNQYHVVSTILTRPSTDTPLCVSVKGMSAHNTRLRSIWGAVSYPLDY